MELLIFLDETVLVGEGAKDVLEKSADDGQVAPAAVAANASVASNAGKDILELKPSSNVMLSSCWDGDNC